MDSKQSFSKDDLYIMMKSYENNIVLNTTLLEHQKLSVEYQKKVIEKQENTLILIKNLIEKLQTNSSSIKDLQEDVQTINSMIEADSKSRFKHINILSKEHNKITIGIYGAMGSLCVMTIGLISLTYQAFVPIKNSLASLLNMVKNLIQ